MHSSSRLTPEESPIWFQNVSWYEKMGKTNRPTSDTLELQIDEEKPQNAFAANLKRHTALAGYDLQELIDAVNNRGNVSLTMTRLKFRRSKGFDTPESCQKPKELAEIAAVLGCTIADLFGIPASETVPKEPTQNEPVIDGVRDALTGPKKEFLLDAIELAYRDFLATGSAYRR